MSVAGPGVPTDVDQWVVRLEPVDDAISAARRSLDATTAYDDAISAARRSLDATTAYRLTITTYTTVRHPKH